MAVQQVIDAATMPNFYTRVAFLALKAAQNVASEDPKTDNHANRVAYSNRILSGADSALLLTLHLVASNATIAGKLEAEGGNGVPDSDIEFALGSIWDARSNAFAPGKS